MQESGNIWIGNIWIWDIYIALLLAALLTAERRRLWPSPRLYLFIYYYNISLLTGRSFKDIGFHYNNYAICFCYSFFIFYYKGDLNIRLNCSKSTINFEGHPRNWRRITLCTDLVYLPEVLPDVELEEVGAGLEFFTFKRFFKKALEDLKAMPEATLFNVKTPGKLALKDAIAATFALSSFFAYIISLMPALAFWYLPAMAYRWSLKSTALIWSPLLWIISPATNALASRLREICRAALYRVMRLYSFVIIVLFSTKLYPMVLA